MTKEQYNSLELNQKEVYDKCNRANKLALFFSWGLAVVVGIGFFIAALPGATKDGFNFLEIFSGFFEMLLFGVFIAGIVPGIVHFGFIFKKIGFGNTLLLWIILGIFILMLYAIILMFIWCAGAVCFIIDTILFIIKKPLIYRWEDKRILAKAGI